MVPVTSRKTLLTSASSSNDHRTLAESGDLAPGLIQGGDKRRIASDRQHITHDGPPRTAIGDDQAVEMANHDSM